MTEKQQKAAFVRQLKPAITAMKREVSNAKKYARGNVPALSKLEVAGGTVVVEWTRFAQHKACLHFHAGNYAISVPMPRCVATKMRDGATAYGALSILDAINDLVRRAGK